MTSIAPEAPISAVQPADVQPAPVAEPAADADLVLADLLVEEISIDGMCGVY